MIHHNFYCMLLCYLPLSEPGVRYFNNGSYADIDCSVNEVSSFLETQKSRCLPSSPETSCSLVFRILIVNKF
jgi:hypothetical protein